MKTHTLRSLSADKVVKKTDAFRARLADIQIVDGFNVRTDDEELREHIAGIVGAIIAGLPIPPLEVWVNPESGVMELVDGKQENFQCVSWRPSTDWIQGGPLIDKYRIEFYTSCDVEACINDVDSLTATTLSGGTHLEAACRVIVAFKLGDEIDVPDELIDSAS